MVCSHAQTAEKYKTALGDVAKYLAEWARVFECQGLVEVAQDASRKAAWIDRLVGESNSAGIRDA